MIGRDLTTSRERGEVADVLIAAEYPIYGRFGYGPAVASTSWELVTGAGTAWIVTIPAAGLAGAVAWLALSTLGMS